MASDALTRQLLDWIGQQPRNYVETMEAWRTSCPRLTVWEDAMSAGLIQRIPAPSMADAAVRVTESGRAWLRHEAGIGTEDPDASPT
jgi:hypothetical protein